MKDSDPVKKTDTLKLRLVVEKLRLNAYIGFWIVVAVGIFLTTRFSGVILSDTLLVKVFGYNNICVYFDFPPSTFFLPTLWAFTLVFLLMYICAHWLQMRNEVAQGNLSRGLYRTLTGLKAFEACTMIIFSTIFAVNPQGPDHTLWIHTIPFFLLQVGLVSLAMSNTVHGIKSGYWTRLGLPTWFGKAAVVYCVLFMLVVLFKIPYAANAMATAVHNAGVEAGNALSDGVWFTMTSSLKTIAQRVDLLFLIFAAVVPMLKTLYLLKTKGDRLEVVYLDTRPPIPTP